MNIISRHWKENELKENWVFDYL